MILRALLREWYYDWTGALSGACWRLVGPRSRADQEAAPRLDESCIGQRIHVYIYRYTYIHRHECIHTYIHMHMCMYIYIDIYMCVNLYYINTRIYTYVYMYMYMCKTHIHIHSLVFCIICICVCLFVSSLNPISMQMKT